MGARPPSTDVDEPPDVVEFGIAALGGCIEDADLDFPTDETELREEIGHLNVPYDASGNEMTVSDVLDGVSEREFESKRDLLNAAHPVFERKRERVGGSLLGHLRRLVPF